MFCVCGDVTNVWMLLRQKSYEAINKARKTISLYQKNCYKFPKSLLIIERNKLLDFAINNICVNSSAKLTFNANKRSHTYIYSQPHIMTIKLTDAKRLTLSCSNDPFVSKRNIINAPPPTTTIHIHARCQHANAAIWQRHTKKNYNLNTQR